MIKHVRMDQVVFCGAQGYYFVTELLPCTSLDLIPCTTNTQNFNLKQF